MYQEEIREVMRDELGRTVSNISEVREGTNTAFIVNCDGDSFIFKIGDFDYKSVELEPYIFDLMRDNNVYTPKVYWRGEINNLYPSFVAEYFSGQSPGYPNNLSDDEIVKFSKDVGKVLGKIQKIEKPAGEFSVTDNELQVFNGGWENIFYDMLDKFSMQAKGNFPEIGSEANRIAHKAGFPELNENAKLCPLDLHTGNLFFSSDGSVQGVIDMERVYSGHPRMAYEINLHSLYAGKESIEEDIHDKFKKGYSQVRSIPEKHPVFEVLAVMREMRAAHIWWDDKSKRKNTLKNRIEKIENKIDQG